MSTTEFPYLPYGGTSGWQDPTSRAAASYLDTWGVTAQTQRAVFVLLAHFKERGGTVKEIREQWPELGHHGRISSALTILHKESLLERLTQKREHCSVYVVRGYAQGRATEQPKKRPVVVDHGPCPQCGYERPA